MIIVGNTLVSEEIFDERFVCDLHACKGACCVEGESGAPLDHEELSALEEVFEKVRPFMNEEGIQTVSDKGLYEVDSDGDFVTPLIGNHGACAYAFFDEQGIAKCSIEKAWLEGHTHWRKPISCHLYPIRLAQLPDYTAINYHHWPVCLPACACGERLGVPVFRFLREPLIRKFGEAWFAELEEVYRVRMEVGRSNS